MRRRQFIELTAACLLPSTALAKWDVSAIAARPDLLYVDERFPQAQREAATWAPSPARIAVCGDVTPFWSRELARRVGEAPAYIRGVTVASFLFCFRTLAAEHADLVIATSRLDRNLIAWSLASTPKPEGQRTPWLNHYHRA